MPCVKEARKRQRVESGDHNTEQVRQDPMSGNEQQPVSANGSMQRGYIYVIHVYYERI